MESLEQFHSIMDMLIEVNKLRQEEIKHRFKDIGNVGYALEFATVRCNIGRRTGKTSYIKKRATDSDVIVVRDEWSRGLYRGIDVFTTEQVMHESFWLGNKSIENVYIDEPTSVFRNVGRIPLYRQILKSSTVGAFVLIGD